MRKSNGPISTGLSEETKRNIYFYHHSIEDHIESLAEQAGNKNLVAPITAEVVRLLEAKTLWETFRSTQSLPEMWPQRNGDRAGGRARGAARAMEANLSGNASGTRSLSAKARKAISKAQRKRWAKFHGEQGRGPGKGHLTAAQRKRSATGIKSYWAKMTPEQRSEEMSRRRELSIKKRRVSAA